MATKYVSVAGGFTYANANSVSTPCTLALAVAGCAAGDTIHVAAGTYPQRVNITNSGTSGAHISFIANGVVNIQYGQATDYGYIVQLTGAYVDLTGFTVTNTQTTNHNSTVKFNAATNCTVSDFTLIDVKGDTFTFVSNAAYNTVSNCTANKGSAGTFQTGANHNTLIDFTITDWDSTNEPGTHSYNTVERLTISGKDVGSGERVGREWVYAIQGSDHFTVKDSVFFGMMQPHANASDEGIHVDIFQHFEGTCTNFTVEGCRFGSWRVSPFDGTQDPAHAVIMLSTETAVEGPFIWRNNVFCSQAFVMNSYSSQSRKWNNFQFTNNTVYSNDDKANNNGVFANMQNMNGDNWVIRDNMFLGCGMDDALPIGTGHVCDYNMYACGYTKPAYEGVNSFNSTQHGADIFAAPPVMDATTNYGQDNDYSLKATSDATAAASDGGDIGALGLTDAVTYTIERQEAGGDWSAAVEIATGVTGTTYSDPTGDYGVEYEYRVSDGTTWLYSNAVTFDANMEFSVVLELRVAYDAAAGGVSAGGGSAKGSLTRGFRASAIAAASGKGLASQAHHAQAQGIAASTGSAGGQGAQHFECEAGGVASSAGTGAASVQPFAEWMAQSVVLDLWTPYASAVMISAGRGSGSGSLSLAAVAEALAVAGGFARAESGLLVPPYRFKLRSDDHGYARVSSTGDSHAKVSGGDGHHARIGGE